MKGMHNVLFRNCRTNKWLYLSNINTIIAISLKNAIYCKLLFSLNLEEKNNYKYSHQNKLDFTDAVCEGNFNTANLNRTYNTQLIENYTQGFMAEQSLKNTIQYRQTTSFDEP